LRNLGQVTVFGRSFRDPAKQISNRHRQKSQNRIKLSADPELTSGVRFAVTVMIYTNDRTSLYLVLSTG